MDTYEVLYTDDISTCEVGDVIRFRAEDLDGNGYDEILRITAIDVDFPILVKGYSEVLNENITIYFQDDEEVEVLGG